MGRVLITGGGGQLASDLEELFEGRAPVHAPTRAQLDISDDEAVRRTFDSVGPELVFNCAAFHNVEVCETEEDRSFAVNARAVKRLAQGCEAAGARLVHLSTNYVFDGRRDAPYSEHDAPSPRSVYALSKLAGEYAALAYCSRALVVRTAGLYGVHGSASKGGNFVTRMVARARESGAQLRMVADQRLSPTFTADLAAALVDGVEREAIGVVHLTSSGACSWHEFTVEIMRLAAIDVAIDAVATTIPPGGADRPLNGVLARPRADELELPSLRHWREGLEDYMQRVGLAAAGQPS
jgi:dTDP-4-dehydrorhamnose reductase